MTIDFDPNSPLNNLESIPGFREIDELLRSRHRIEDSIIKLVEDYVRLKSLALWDSMLRRFGQLTVDKSNKIKPTQSNVSKADEISLFASMSINQITNRAVKLLIEGTDKLNPFYIKEINQIFFGNRSITKKSIFNVITSRHTKAVLVTNLENFRDAGNTMIRKMRRELIASLFSRLSPNEISQRISRHIRGVDKNGNLLQKYAKVYAQTAYNAYAGAISNDLAPDEDVVAYRYSGPADGKNRNFCGRFVKQVVPKKEMLEAIEGQQGATIHNPGGWNCRHKIHPIFKDDPRVKRLLNG